MRVAKDGEFDALYGSKLSTSVNITPLDSLELESGSFRSAVSSGSYEILVGPPSWPNVEIFITSARYIIVGGTQNVSVSGMISGVINSIGGVAFIAPFRGPLGVETAGICSGMEESTRIPVPCSCWYDPVFGISLRVFPAAAVTNFMFSVSLMLPIV